MFGNAELLACESRVWGCVVDIMYRDSKVKVKTGQKRRVGYNLPLQCTNHGRKVWIEEPGDWDDIHGGCDKACTGVLPCSHKCRELSSVSELTPTDFCLAYRCHPFGHDQVNCMMQCSLRLSCGHSCVGKLHSPSTFAILRDETGT
jgi:helicase required for RNAi-mediated heterochromatin assembly 1